MKIEFYFDHSGFFQKKIYFKLGDRPGWEDFENLTPEEIETIFKSMIDLSPKAHEALLHMSRYIHTGKKDILKQFIHCNWTVLDRKWDISDQALNFESVECPHKHTNNCPFSGKGIICLKN